MAKLKSILVGKKVTEVQKVNLAFTFCALFLINFQIYQKYRVFPFLMRTFAVATSNCFPCVLNL